MLWTSKNLGDLGIAVAVVTLGLVGASERLLMAASQSGAQSEVSTSVSVQVFSNITGQASDDWMGRGIAETIAAGLDGIAGLVVSRTEGTEENTAAFESRWVIRGAYQRLGDRLRLTARMTNVETGDVVRSATVDGRIDELFVLQDRLVDNLRAVFEGGQQAAMVAMAPVAIAPADPPVAQQAAVDTVPPGRSDTASSQSLVIDGPPAPEPPATINRGANGELSLIHISSPRD